VIRTRSIDDEVSEAFEVRRASRRGGSQPFESLRVLIPKSRGGARAALLPSSPVGLNACQILKRPAGPALPRKLSIEFRRESPSFALVRAFGQTRAIDSLRMPVHSALGTDLSARRERSASSCFVLNKAAVHKSVHPMTADACFMTLSREHPGNGAGNRLGFHRSSFFIVTPGTFPFVPHSHLPSTSVSLPALCPVASSGPSFSPLVFFRIDPASYPRILSAT